MIKIKSPAWIELGKNKHSLNMNIYRNLHYRVLNNLKKAYAFLIEDETIKIDKVFDKIGIIYVVYKGDKRRYDINNITSVHAKFFEDALVGQGKLKDDNSKYLPVSCNIAGGIDPKNPRVDIYLYDFSKKIERTNYVKKISQFIEEGAQIV